jgi:hypothetical protein
VPPSLPCGAARAQGGGPIPPSLHRTALSGSPAGDKEGGSLMARSEQGRDSVAQLARHAVRGRDLTHGRRDLHRRRLNLAALGGGRHTRSDDGPPGTHRRGQQAGQRRRGPKPRKPPPASQHEAWPRPPFRRRGPRRCTEAVTKKKQAAPWRSPRDKQHLRLRRQSSPQVKTKYTKRSSSIAPIPPPGHSTGAPGREGREQISVLRLNQNGSATQIHK